MSVESIRECKRLYQRRWARTHPREMAERRERTALPRRTLLSALRQRPCLDCGQNFAECVMEFDHARGTPRKRQFENRSLGFGQLCIKWRLLLPEIAKIDVVCANCHAIRTYTRRTLGIPIAGRLIGGEIVTVIGVCDFPSPALSDILSGIDLSAIPSDIRKEFGLG